MSKKPQTRESGWAGDLANRKRLNPGAYKETTPVMTRSPGKAQEYVTSETAETGARV